MNETFSRILGFFLVLLFFAAVLGPCLSTGPPAVDPRVIGHQLELVNQTLDVLHEEVAAAQSPSRWPFVLFMFSILAPLGAGIWLLWRCEKSLIGHDQVIRTMIRSGLKESVVQAYLEDTTCPQLPGPNPSGQLIGPPIHRGRRRHRRRWRRKIESDKAQ